MAVLVKQPEATRSILFSPHRVGRSRSADLHITELTVSGDHARLEWTGREWQLHDLGSRNGTIVDGRRLSPGERVALSRGMTIAFGHADNAWLLEDDSAPTITAIPTDGSEPLCAVNDLLALPSEDNPEVEIYRDAVGEWLIEHRGETERIRDRSPVRAAGREFLLRIPDVIQQTIDNAWPSPLNTLNFKFSVSRDEEFIALIARHSRGEIDLGARAHHAVLLALARQRLADRKEGRPDTAEGWMYQDDLANQLGMDESHLNVAVFRCRRQLAEAGIMGAAGIVERRRPTREVRLGVAQFEIVTV